MNLLQPPAFAPYLFFVCTWILLFKVFSSLVGASPLPFDPPDNIAINCGYSGSKTAHNGREWIGDIGSMYFVSREPNSKSISSAPVERSSPFHAIPFSYARISQTQFTYVFRISPGPKFIRLHFNPASYRGFHRSNAFFTVKANSYTLLHNFSASLTADAHGQTTVSKEFSLNVDANQPLIITFSPSRTSPSDEVYAFVNGIEVVSMPNGLYYAMKENNEWEHKMDFTSHWGNTALETLHRLNIGGSSISSSEDTGMFREWFEDTKFFLHFAVLPLSTTMRIKYRKVSDFVAPQSVYQTSWYLDQNRNNAKDNINFTWKIPVDQGFRYLFRFHFCELDYEIKESGRRVFNIYLDNYMVEPHGDIINWSGEFGVATFKDYIYVVEGDRMDGTRDILITLCPVANQHNEPSSELVDVILKGLEILKLSNPDNNLASTNPLVSSFSTTTTKPSKLRKSLYKSAGGNLIATVIVIIITTLSIVSYQLQPPREDFQKVMIFPLQYEGLCRRFSLAEVQYATKNFNNDLVLGKGGFGKVYKGCIDSERNIVAMKRLHPGSKQGPTEFWTEIEMLSELRNDNLVTLIGFCDEGSEMILVYEYMEYGTLADRLYKINNQGTGASPLSWEDRLKICIDAARGLKYLHSCNEQGIIHRDVKSTNILLSKNLVAKIADFGLSKVVPASHSITHISTSVKGTFGYLDPEYFLTRRLTKKSDVYAFGVVLWEVLCGRPAIDANAEGPERSLALWAQYCFSEGLVDEIIEPVLRGQMSTTCLVIFTQVAYLCLKNLPSERPTMEEVVEKLELALVSMELIGKEETNSTIVLTNNDGIVSMDQMVNEDTNSTILSTDNNNLPNSEMDFASSPSQEIISSPSNTLNVPDRIEGLKKKSRIGKMFQTFALWGSRFSAKPVEQKMKTEIDVPIAPVNNNPPPASATTKNNYPPPASATTKYTYPPPASATTKSRLVLIGVPNFMFDLEDLLRASAEVLGKGTYGTSYKAIMETGLVLAVKRLKDVVVTKEEFSQNMEALALMDHENLVKLKAYYYSKDEKLLVFDYSSTGSLSMVLQEMHGSHTRALDWVTRIGIARGVARGIAYIHAQGPDKFHGNIKSSNILLTTSLEPRIADACIWPLVRFNFYGHTSGYTVPESGRNSQQADVYSYGILLLELLTGKPPTQTLVAKDGLELHGWIQAVGLKNIEGIIEVIKDFGRLSYDNSNYEYMLQQLVILALVCADQNPNIRPPMTTVVSKLEQIELLNQRRLNFTDRNENTMVEERY